MPDRSEHDIKIDARLEQVQTRPRKPGHPDLDAILSGVVSDFWAHTLLRRLRRGRISCFADPSKETLSHIRGIIRNATDKLEHCHVEDL
jgi:hypothetical protein